MTTSKTEITADIPVLGSLIQVSNNETVTAEIENQNNLLALNAIILAYNWIIDSGVELTGTNIFTAAQTFSAGLKAGTIDPLTTNGDIILNVGSGGLYNSSMTTTTKYLTQAEVSALITSGSSVVDGVVGDITIAGSGATYTLTSGDAGNLDSGTLLDARLSSNAMLLDTAQEYTATKNFNMTTLTDATNIAWDLAANQVSTVTLAGNRTLSNPTNKVAGATYLLIVNQDGTGSRTLAYGSEYKWVGGAVPTLTTTASAIDVLTFICDGTNMLGVSALAFS